MSKKQDQFPDIVETEFFISWDDPDTETVSVGFLERSLVMDFDYAEFLEFADVVDQVRDVYQSEPGGARKRRQWHCAARALIDAADRASRSLLIIGITGNIACGKSTVDAILVELGATAVFDADRTVHDLLRDDPGIHRQVLEAFGSVVLAEDGSIDRRRLGSVVFADAAALRRLEGILHPAVRARIRAQVAALPEDALAVIDAVKLLEGDLGDLVTSVWWVTARPEQQLERLVRGRGLSEEAALARLAAQPPLDRYRDRVHVVIDNSGSLAETHSQVAEALENLRAAHVGRGPAQVDKE